MKLDCVFVFFNRATEQKMMAKRSNINIAPFLMDHAIGSIPWMWYELAVVMHSYVYYCFEFYYLAKC